MQNWFKFLAFLITCTMLDLKTWNLLFFNLVTVECEELQENLHQFNLQHFSKVTKPETPVNFGKLHNLADFNYDTIIKWNLHRVVIHPPFLDQVNGI